MAEVRITTAERQKIGSIDANPFYEGNAESSDGVLELSEIEIRFQFQGKENKRDGLDGSSLNLTMKQGGEERDCEFVMTGDRKAFAGAVFSRTTNDVC